MSRQQADHLCPPWIACFLLANPLRRLLYTPRSILAPYVAGGMTAVEPGPGMGFFTLELAHLVGTTGRVVGLDVQPRMLEVLKRRAQRAGVLDRVELRLIKADGLGITDVNGKVDFFLAFAMVHEVPDPRRFFAEAFVSLKKGGRVLFSEPMGHIDAEHFSRELDLATAEGLRVESRPRIRMSRSALLVKD